MAVAEMRQVACTVAVTPNVVVTVVTAKADVGAKPSARHASTAAGRVDLIVFKIFINYDLSYNIQVGVRSYGCSTRRQDQSLAESGNAEPRVGQVYCTTLLSVAAEDAARTTI
jgi:hypothetical protein